MKTWQCPEGTGVPLITMPNVPRALHGLPPRKIMGQTTWDRVRKRCYFDADYKCEICGADFVKPHYAAHELYSYDWKKGTGTFERCIAVCRTCHDAIHSGRLVTMFKQHNPLYPKSYVLKVTEHCFRLVHDYNLSHPDTPLRIYATYLDYLDEPELHDEVERLIAKYQVQFYAEPHHIAGWSKWRLIWNGKEYPSPYKSRDEWLEAMAKNTDDKTRGLKDPFGDTNLMNILEE